MATMLDAVIRLKDNFSDTIKTVEDNVKNFSRTAKNMGRDAQRVGKDLESTGSKFTTMVTAPIIAGVTASVHEYAKLEQSIGGVETLFEGSAGEVIKNSESAYKRAGVSANDYMENVTSFSASLLQGVGGDTEKAAKIADMAMTDMADNANKFGTDIVSIQNSYQGFAKDNFTMLDNLKLGYGGTASEMARMINETGVMGKGFKATAQNVKDVPFNKMIEAIHKVQSGMGVTGTTSKEAMSTVAGSIGMAKASLQDFLGGLGNSKADVDQLAKNMIESFKVAVKNIKKVIATIWDNIPLTKWQKNVIAFVGGAGPVLAVIGKMTDGIGGLITKFGTFAGRVKTMGLTAAIFTPGVKIALVIAAIIAAVILLIKNWDKIKAKVNQVFPNAGKTIAKWSNYIKNIFNGVSKAISIAWKFLIPIFTGVWGAIKNIFIVAVETIGGVIGGLLRALSGIIDFLTGVFTGNWSLAWSGIKDIFGGIFDGLTALAKAPINAIIGLVNGMITGLNKIKLPKWVPIFGGKGINIPLIPKLASGTDYWRGGIVQVHERGGEIIDLPRGSRVYPHDESVAMARRSGKTEIHIPKLADQIIIREDSDIDKLAGALVREIEKASLNMA